MKRLSKGPRRGFLFNAGLAGILCITAASSACGQLVGRDAAANAASANLDSLMQRAENSRMKGPETARVTLIEVSDFQCPYCRQFFDSTYAKLDSAYIRTGKVRLVFMAFPLPGHREAYGAAKAAFCAGAQGKFWPMHDQLFSRQREWSGAADPAARFAGYAAGMQLDAGAYRSCVENDRVAPIILNDVMRASGAGIGGTPTFILNGKALSGAIPFSDLKQELDAALSAPAAPAPGATPPAAPPAGTRPGTPPAGAPPATPPPATPRP
ncbi:MAG TPA: thioredoxin domain-containing protein [Longimicrobiaceae bacterium]|jgi:protein-disulfide isomerase|nr:thioredoxin domain-containing protein [Longimicrobiaceae bacterium]